MPAKSILQNGQKIQDLIFIKETEPGIRSNGSPIRRGLFLCTCGKEFIVNICAVKNKNTRSCGCLVKKLLSENSRTHGLSKTSIFKRWDSMLGRCYNKNNSNYTNYGGRGIKVCDRWHSFELFYKDVGVPPFEKATLDRIDNNGNYEPSNVRWANKYEQNRNQRPVKTSKTGVRGVSLLNGKYRVVKSYNYKNFHLGVFDTLEQARKVAEDFDEKHMRLSSQF